MKTTYLVKWNQGDRWLKELSDLQGFGYTPNKASALRFETLLTAVDLAMRMDGEVVSEKEEDLQEKIKEILSLFDFNPTNFAGGKGTVPQYHEWLKQEIESILK